MKYATLVIAGAMATGGVANAQTQDAAPPAPSAQQAPGTPAPAPATPAPEQQAPATSSAVTDQQVAKFAEASLKLQNLDENPSMNPDQRLEQALAIVEEVGLERTEFNWIATGVKQDPQLLERVQLAAAEYAQQQ